MWWYNFVLSNITEKKFVINGITYVSSCKLIFG